MIRQKFFKSALMTGALAGFSFVTLPGTAATFTVDGTAATYTRLSDAVSSASEAGPGAHVINITTDSLPTPDVEIFINFPVTINGDADNNGISCDILVDMALLRTDAWEGVGTTGSAHTKSYFEIQANGDVTIRDLKIHPNANGISGTVGRRRVNGVRTYRPVGEGEVGNYTLENVRISGSDADLNYVDLATSADLYSVTPNKWANDNGNNTENAVIQLANLPSDALGYYNSSLIDCHAGLGQSSAINIDPTSGTHVLSGGLYGHALRDGIRLTGTSITLTGSQTNRIRVVRVPNESGQNAHGIEAFVGAQVDMMEYADVATILSGNNFNISNNGTVVHKMRLCRGLGKLTQTANAAYFIHGDSRLTAENCTFVGSGSDGIPFHTAATYDGIANISDTIFSSEQLGVMRNDNSDAIGVVQMNYCAIPTDGVTSESLATPPIVHAAGDLGTFIHQNTLSLSPQYLLTLEDYDWTDDQGASQVGNGPGNVNVLRPTNPAYLTASSIGGPLFGGAGPALSGINSNEWMLME